MNTGSNHARGTGFLISGILSIILGAVFGALVSDADNDLRYYFDSDYRAGMEIMSFLGMIFLICGVGNIIAAIVFFAVGDKPSVSSLISCTYCGQRVSRTATICPRCGLDPVRPSVTYIYRDSRSYGSGYSGATPPPPPPPKAAPPRAPRQDPSIWKPAEQQSPLIRTCSYCRQKVGIGESFCSNCGRRV